MRKPRVSYKTLDIAKVLSWIETWYIYDRENFQFLWKKIRGGVRKTGVRAGTNFVSPEGTKYFQVRVCGKVVREHNLIWLLEKGCWPQHEIDHVDGDGANNNIDNLRDVPHGTNSKNQRLNRRNVTGTPGIRWNKKNRKWSARIHRDGSDWWLGLFAKIEDAIAARKAAEREVKYHENHGKDRIRHE